MNEFDQNEAEHTLKGLPRLRFNRPKDSLQEAGESYYRWWWEFLRLSKDYWLISQTAHRDERGRLLRVTTIDHLLRRIYFRFGDIHNVSFETWWQKRGYRLFSERQPFPKVSVIPDTPRLRIKRPADDHIWVDIPLKLSARTIKRQIGKILGEHSELRLDDRRRLTTAEYHLSPSRLSLHTLKRTHEVYCLHRELIAKPMALNQVRGAKRHQADFAKRADLFRIGKLLHLSPSNESLRGTANEIYAKQNQMRVAVSRILKNAQRLITQCEHGQFPSYEEVTPQRRFSERQSSSHQALEEAWWALDLTSSLSADKLSQVRAIHYEEAERERQLDITKMDRRVVHTFHG